MSLEDLTVEGLLSSLGEDALMAKQASAEEQTTEASIQKQASASTSKDSSMSDIALAGRELAAQLIKAASVGDVNTENGMAPGAAPNKAIADNAQLVAEQGAVSNKPTPGTGDGDSGGTVNQIFDAIVADAMGQGAATNSVVQSGLSTVEGMAAQSGAPAQVPVGEADEEVEKTAAVWSLVQGGVDFDSAVALVKQAAEEIVWEEDQQIKQAAMGELMAAGVDFDSAVALVKSAGLGDYVNKAREWGAAKGQAAAEKVRSAYGAAQEAAHQGAARAAGAYEDLAARAAAHGQRLGLDAGTLRDAVTAPGLTMGQRAGVAGGALAGLGTNPLVYGPAGVAAAGALGAAAYKHRGAIAEGAARLMGRAPAALAAPSHLGRAMDFARKNPYAAAGAGLGAAGALGGAAYLANEKRAAVNALVQNGVDFDVAADLVTAKSYEMYGA